MQHPNICFDDNSNIRVLGKEEFKQTEELVAESAEFVKRK
jgi:hypothetical protein